MDTIINNEAQAQAQAQVIANENKELDNIIERNKKIIRKIKKITEKDKEEKEEEFIIPTKETF